jgi:hypothetical protein
MVFPVGFDLPILDSSFLQEERSARNKRKYSFFKV